MTWSGPASTIAPTRIGTPIAAAAVWMPARVCASLNGSTAVEFSGHSTKSGSGRSPAATSAASSTVARTWLSVTWRKSASTSVPSPGTSPCTEATRKVPSGLGSQGCRAGASRTAAAPTSPAPAASGRRSRIASAASDAPARASSRLTPVAPTYASAGATGVSTTANASRPHGIPLNGHPLRSTSIADHATATQTGQNGSRRRRGTAAPNRP